MRDDICTIPVSEAFEPKDGCPLCRMRAVVEQRVVDYIMGAAMMEPDVRMQTNAMGFCKPHFEKMRHANNRLSLALMLDSHLLEIEKSVFGEGKWLQPSAKKIAYKAVRLQETCFICDKMNFGVERMLSTVYRQYENDRAFRDLYAAQSDFCLPHCTMMIENVPSDMKKGRSKELVEVTKEITLNKLKELSQDVRHFCDMFDYRNSGEDADWGTAKDAIERSIAFLDGTFQGRV